MSYLPAGWPLLLTVAVAAVLVAVCVYQWAHHRRRHRVHVAVPHERPGLTPRQRDEELDRLRLLYMRGEIDEEVYEERVDELHRRTAA